MIFQWHKPIGISVLRIVKDLSYVDNNSSNYGCNSKSSDSRNIGCDYKCISSSRSICDSNSGGNTTTTSSNSSSYYDN